MWLDVGDKQLVLFVSMFWGISYTVERSVYMYAVGRLVKTGCWRSPYCSLYISPDFLFQKTNCNVNGLVQSKLAPISSRNNLYTKVFVRLPYIIVKYVFVRYILHAYVYVSNWRQRFRTTTSWNVFQAQVTTRSSSIIQAAKCANV